MTEMVATVLMPMSLPSGSDVSNLEDTKAPEAEAKCCIVDCRDMKAPRSCCVGMRLVRVLNEIARIDVPVMNSVAITTGVNAG